MAKTPQGVILRGQKPGEIQANKAKDNKPHENMFAEKYVARANGKEVALDNNNNRPRWSPRISVDTGKIAKVIENYRISAKASFSKLLTDFFYKSQMTKTEVADRLSIVPSGVSKMLSVKEAYYKDPVTIDQIGRYAYAVIKKPIVIKVYPSKDGRVEMRVVDK